MPVAILQDPPALTVIRNYQQMYLHPISAYVYKITCLTTGQYYYGYRCKNIKLKRTPVEDFWVYYFSSSNQINNLINQYGLSNFNAEILSQHIDADSAYWQEQQNIKDSWGDLLLMNKHFVDPIINNAHMFRATAHSAKKGYQTALRKGTLNINAAAAVEKRMLSRYKNNTLLSGVTAMNTPEVISKRSQSRSRQWQLTNPSNEVLIITNLAQFCRNNNLSASGMRFVASGKRSHHKGWHCLQLYK